MGNFEGTEIGNLSAFGFPYKLRKAASTELQRINGLERNDPDALLDELKGFGYTGKASNMTFALHGITSRLNQLSIVAANQLLAPAGPPLLSPRAIRPGAVPSPPVQSLFSLKTLGPGVIVGMQDVSYGYTYGCGASSCRVESFYVY